MKFDDLLNSFINEKQQIEQQPLNPGVAQLKAYFTRKLNTPEGRESVANMLVDIFRKSEQHIIAAVEKHYQTIRSEYRSLQQRNAPLGRAAVARKAQEEQQPLNPGASQLKAYITRKLNTPEGRESVANMLVDIFTESEQHIIAAVEEHYQTIRNEYKSLQQRNAPLGRAAVARKAQAVRPPSK